MSDNIVSMIEHAIAETRAWPTKGWTVQFGRRKTEVNNLKAALDLPDTFVFKLEAIAYWKRVERSAEEAVVWGQKALEAAKKGDMKGVEDAAFYARFVEFPMREKSIFWDPIYRAVKAKTHAA